MLPVLHTEHAHRGGDCPEGHHVAEPPDPDEEGGKVPWHFWLLVIALAIYLGWRLVQGIEWLLR
ncbi:MAG: hypothetical protein R2698_11020 [Microthrixaceae bacterium]